MISETYRVQLKDEIALGKRALNAYNLYVKDYIELCNQSLFAEFSNCSIEIPDRILEIKRLQVALKSLEISILNDVDTGKLAEKQLNQLEGNENE